MGASRAQPAGDVSMASGRNGPAESCELYSARESHSAGATFAAGEGGRPRPSYNGAQNTMQASAANPIKIKADCSRRR